MMGTPCRHCGSPARGRPCYWAYDRPDEHASFDAPCDVDIYHERIDASNLRVRRIWLAVVSVVGIGIVWWALGGR